MKRIALPLGVVLLLASLTTCRLDADIFEYCNVAGDSIDFVDIMEMTQGQDPLFGQPEAHSDILTMPGFGFNVSAIDGIDFKQALMELTIKALPGQKIDSIQLNEFGSYFQFGENTNVIAHTSAFVEIDGQMYDAETTFSNEGTGSGNWNQSLQIDFPETSELRLVIDAQVMASALGNEVAFVDKIGMNVGVSSVSAVPEPEVAGLCSMLALGFMFARRRKLRPVSA